MLRGYFDNLSSRPFFDGELRIPRFDKIGRVSFLLDTGSDCTVLMPKDAKLFGITLADVANCKTDEAVGFNGASEDYLEPAHVLLTNPNTMTFMWHVELRICLSDNEDCMTIPSILGRDVIDRLRLTYDRLGKLLIAEVNEADKKTDLTKKPVK